MNKKYSSSGCLIFAALLFLLFHSLYLSTAKAVDLRYILDNESLQQIGKKMFFDENLSTPSGQSCAACHGPEVGWTGDEEELNKAGAVYSGAVRTRYGNRKPTSVAYATTSPFFQHTKVADGKPAEFMGGNFWDGRATGWKLGNPAADQAQGPFLNPVEQNNPTPQSVVLKVCESEYAGEFQEIVRTIWGIEDICKEENTEKVYGIIALAIAAYENSKEVNQFSSKYDYYLKGMVDFTPLEKKGLELFEGKAHCSNCHISQPGPKGEPPLFTDYTYDNVGIPKNPLNPWYTMPPEFNPDGKNWIDPGLAGFIKDIPQYAMSFEDNYGKHKVPTLRNVDKRPFPEFVKAYGHNGYFKSLQEVVHFYNTRDVESWPPPEVLQNINKSEIGNLSLSADEEAALVTFLKTLSDGYDASLSQVMWKKE